MMAKKKEDLTNEKVQVYESIFAMFMKFVLMIAALTAFFIILYFFIKTEDNISKGIYGALDTLLGGSAYKLYSHYFPDSNKKKY